MIRPTNLEMTRRKITELWIEHSAIGNETALTGYRELIKREIKQQEEIISFGPA